MNPRMVSNGQAARRGSRVRWAFLQMGKVSMILSLLILAATVALPLSGSPSTAGLKPEPRQRGRARAEVTRPDHFPHRIWAACDFEGRTPDYAWFGPAEKRNIPVYPGNATAL